MFTGTRSDSADVGRRLLCDEFVVPESERQMPASMPPASVLAPLIKASLSRLGVSGGRACVAMAGPHLILRYFLGSEARVREEMRQAIDRSINYIQFGLGDRVVGHHSHGMDDGRVHALLGVSAAATVDPLAEALEQCGLHLAVVEPSLVALTRIASIEGRLDDRAALMVCVTADGIDIGVVADKHVLFCLRPTSVPTSDNSDQPSKPITDLKRELEKMIRHYQRAFGATEDIRRVILCGPDDLLAPHIDLLEASKEFDAEVLTVGEAANAALCLSAADPQTQDPHVAATGAAIGLLTDVSDVVGPNLTSEPEVRQRSTLEAVARALLWPTVIAFAIWGASALAGGQVSSALARLRIEADRPSPVETKYRELQMQLTQTEQRGKRLTELVRLFEHRDSKGLLEALRACVSEDVWLSRVRLADNQNVTIEGAAYDERVIYEFRENLEKSPRFANATVTTTTATRYGNTIVTEFSLECEAPSLSAVPNGTNR